MFEKIKNWFSKRLDQVKSWWKSRTESGFVGALIGFGADLFKGGIIFAGLIEFCEVVTGITMMGLGSIAFGVSLLGGAAWLAGQGINWWRTREAQAEAKKAITAAAEVVEVAAEVAAEKAGSFVEAQTVGA